MRTGSKSKQNFGLSSYIPPKTRAGIGKTSAWIEQVQPRETQSLIYFCRDANIRGFEGLTSDA